MDVEINWLAVVLATLSTMVVGAVWYTPKVFGNAWISLANLDVKQMEKNGIRPMIITLLVSLITAFVLAHFSFLAFQFYQGEYSFLSVSLITAFWAWLGFTAARFITHDSFEGRRKKLTLLNVSHELFTFLAMGLVIGVMGV